MRFRIAPLLVGLSIIPNLANAFTCDQVVWAVEHLSEAQLARMAVGFNLSNADREKARSCLREARLKEFQLEASKTPAVHETTARQTSPAE
jgi:hypothetical protein